MSDLHRVEVSAITGRAVLKGFGAFTLVASKYLLEAGLGREAADGSVELENGAWYPLDTWLGVMDRIAREYGDRVVFKIGQSLVDKGPAGSTDIPSMLRNLDGAYHRNHRLDGRLMLDPVTGGILDGIGGYAGELVSPGLALARCDNPYPCAFDHGMLTALAAKFAAGATVTHEPGGCRKDGAKHCTYRLSWRAS